MPSHSDNQPLILNSARTFSNRGFYNWLFNELIEHDHDNYFTYHISAEERMLSSSPSSSYLNTSGRFLSGLAANWTIYSVCCCSPNRSQLGEYTGTPKQTWQNRPAHAFFVAIIFALIFLSSPAMWSSNLLITLYLLPFGSISPTIYAGVASQFDDSKTWMALKFWSRRLQWFFCHICKCILFKWIKQCDLLRLQQEFYCEFLHNKMSMDVESEQNKRWCKWLL